MWEALVNTRNNFRVMSKNNGKNEEQSLTDPKSPFLAEPVHLGYDLKRQEKRLKVQSQVEIIRSKSQVIHSTEY